MRGTERPRASDPEAGAGSGRATYHIGEVADRVGLSLRTVRYYEEAGLVLPVGRTTGGFRLYDDAAVERLVLVKHMKPLGFALDDMRLLLEVRDALGEGGHPDTREPLLGRLEMFAAAARERYLSLVQQLAVAESFVDLLDDEVSRHRGDRSP